MQSFYQWFYSRLPVKKVTTDDQVHLLTEVECKRLDELENKATWVAAFFGAMGVVLLFVPRYLFPHWFPVLPVSLGAYRFGLPIVFMAWSAVLVFIELFLLTLLHIYCIHEIAVQTGFLTYERKAQESLQSILMKVSREQKDTSIERFGIDPLEGMNKKALFFWNIVIKLKASLSNLFFKFVIQRMMGRYAFQWLQDMAGIPVFALWNAWGTKQVLRQGRVIIMGQNLVEKVTEKCILIWTEAEVDKPLLFRTLQFVAISKRDYHANHAILAQQLIGNYNVQKPAADFDKNKYLECLQQANKQNQQLCLLILILGFLLDGMLSNREKKRLIELQSKGLNVPTYLELKQMQRTFLAGKEIRLLWDSYMKQSNTVYL
jgi:hypothetical protein